MPQLITNVRLRVDSVDGDGTTFASASGWVIGDAKPGGRGYFWVPDFSVDLCCRWKLHAKTFPLEFEFDWNTRMARRSVA